MVQRAKLQKRRSENPLLSKMVVLHVLVVLVVLIAGIPGSFQQNMRGGRDGRQGKKRRPKIDAAGAVGEKQQMMRALTINYPLSVFETTNTVDWRAPATYSTALVRSSETEKSWKDISQAQDQEDVWLYENWFYGMKDGVIMESGALNGILFSNSYMFEQFANWTAIHVGMFCIDRLSLPLNLPF